MYLTVFKLISNEVKITELIWSMSTYKTVLSPNSRKNTYCLPIKSDLLHINFI